MFTNLAFSNGGTTLYQKTPPFSPSPGARATETCQVRRKGSRTVLVPGTDAPQRGVLRRSGKDMEKWGMLLMVRMKSHGKSPF